MGKEQGAEMSTLDFSDELQRKVTEFAIQSGQTPEQTVLEIIEERMDHQSAYNETAYLMKSENNRVVPPEYYSRIIAIQVYDSIEDV